MKTLWTRIKRWTVGTVLAILAALGLYHVPPVESQTPTYAVSLTLPTAYTSGIALPVGDITSYTIAYRVGSATTYTTKVVNGPFTALPQATTIPKALGTTCANAFVNVGAVASAATSPDLCVVNTGPPNPPSGVAVN